MLITNAPIIIQTANPTSKALRSMSWLPSPEHADWWYLWASRGLTWFGVMTAIFLLLQLWASGERDKRTELRTSALEAQTAEAKREAATATQASDALKLKTREVELDLEKERIARLQLEDKQAQLLNHQAQRVLSAEQKHSLVAALSPFRDQRVHVTFVASDGESKRFSEDFVAVFKSAGWAEVGGGLLYNYDVDPIGIQVVVNDADFAAGRVPPAAIALPKALAAIGLIAQGLHSNNVSPADIEFRIGSKPPLFNGAK